MRKIILFIMLLSLISMPVFGTDVYQETADMIDAEQLEEGLTSKEQSLLFPLVEPFPNNSSLFAPS